MRVATICDIHGNFPALKSVYEDIRKYKVDLIIVGGDIVPGPQPHETINFLLHSDIPVKFIQGNGDREVVNSKYGQETKTLSEQALESIRWNASQLNDKEINFLQSFPKTFEIESKELGKIFFCHATPRNDTDIFTKNTPEKSLLSIFNSVNADVIICGHTHMQFDRKVGAMRVINAGSVGMPFGKPGAYWLLINSVIEFRYTEYDLINAAYEIKRTQYPQAIDFTENYILHPPSEEKMLAAFANSELK